MEEPAPMEALSATSAESWIRTAKDLSLS